MQKYVEILEFTHFTEFWTFREVGVNHKEKVQVRNVEVSVVFEIQQKKLSDKKVEFAIAVGIE